MYFKIRIFKNMFTMLPLVGAKTKSTVCQQLVRVRVRWVKLLNTFSVIINIHKNYLLIYGHPKVPHMPLCKIKVK